MPLTNQMVISLKRKYGVPLHNFFEKWTSGISYLKSKLENLYLLWFDFYKELKPVWLEHLTSMYIDLQYQLSRKS